MEPSPDFTQRRGHGCYENEVRNIFHLASLPEPVDIAKTLRDYRGNIAEKVYDLFVPADYGSGGHTAGWNAAIEAVLKVIADAR